MVKVLIGLLENTNKWMSRTEEKLCKQDNLSTIFQLPTTINRLLTELEVTKTYYNNIFLKLFKICTIYAYLILFFILFLSQRT